MDSGGILEEGFRKGIPEGFRRDSGKGSLRDSGGRFYGESKACKNWVRRESGGSPESAGERSNPLRFPFQMRWESPEGARRDPGATADGFENHQHFPRQSFWRQRSAKSFADRSGFSRLRARPTSAASSRSVETASRSRSRSRTVGAAAGMPAPVRQPAARVRADAAGGHLSSKIVR